MSDTLATSVENPSLLYIERSRLIPDPKNVREKLTHIDELAQSIREQGLAQALLVRALDDGRYMVTDGHRRLAAAELLQLDPLPCMIRELDDAQARKLQVVTAIQRDELGALAIAEALKTMVAESNEKAVADSLGKSPAWVRRHLALLKLPTAVTNALKKRGLGLNHAEQARKTFTDEGIDAALTEINAVRQLTRNEAKAKAAATKPMVHRQNLTADRGDNHLELRVESNSALSEEQISEFNKLLKSMLYTFTESATA